MLKFNHKMLSACSRSAKLHLRDATRSAMFNGGDVTCFAGIIGNLIVYLITWLMEAPLYFPLLQQLTLSLANGSSSLFPIVAAADSFFGSFPVALVSYCVSFLAIINTPVSICQWYQPFCFALLLKIIGLLLTIISINIYMI